MHAATTNAQPRTPAISLQHITRRCGAVIANNDVTLDIVPGRIHALVGENGAGKTTLMRIAYGLLTPDSGQVTIDGRPVHFRRPADAMRHGIGMVHQHFMLVDTLTVAENICLGREPRGAFGALDRAAAERDVAERSARHGLPVNPKARVSTLSVGEQQRVEILKALHHGARVLILDEPTAVLTPQEVDGLFLLLRELQREGTSIMLITHKLAEVKALAEHVSVMRAGRIVGEAATQDVSIETIAGMMMGRPMAPRHARTIVAPGAPLLEARGLEVCDERGLPAVRDVSFAVRAGEIVGIAGVEGNGQHELIEAIAGLRRAQRGELSIAGQRVHGHSAAEHTRAGLAHVPSDRLRRGMVAAFSLAENLVLGRQREPAAGRGPFLPPARLAAHALPLLKEFDVRPADPRAITGQLSGGNQQKLVVARELTRGARVVLVAHPTRGVDLGAIEFIHGRLREERAAGRAVLLVSSELSEILELSDRILVMYGGSIVHETTAEGADERTLGQYMLGKNAAD